MCLEGSRCEEAQGTRHLKPEAKAGILLPQAKECLTYQKQEEARKDPSPAGFGGNMVLLTS